MSTEVTIRLGTVDDTERMVQLLAGGALTNPEDPSDLGPYRDAVVEITASPGTELLVAEVDGEVVGVCQLITFRHLQVHGGLCAEIESVHVDASHRGAGIGTVLLDAAVERARAAGCYRVQLTSNRARVDARRFYLRHGFTDSHTGFKLTLDAGPGDASAG